MLRSINTNEVKGALKMAAYKLLKEKGTIALFNNMRLICSAKKNGNYTIMNAIIITSTNKTDLKLFADLANRIGASIKTLTSEEYLDFGLLKAMEEGRNSKFVSKESVMKKLKRDGN